MNSQTQNELLGILSAGLETAADEIQTLAVGGTDLVEILRSEFPEPTAQTVRLIWAVERMRNALAQSTQMMRTVSALADEAKQ
ncbi:MAG: hypothetical protein NXI28_24500 [bacterium]|nr:hypothetical protein [bacterium]|tara:strand:- start:271 stop:519 length:249 start_codon:yes stop_codon:yes gene_type:complete